jgi:hypothetical protein
LTRVATEQTKAAIDAADSARKQSNLLSSQLEQATAPLLVAEPDDRLGSRGHKLVNRGPGIAFQIFWWHGKFDAKNQSDIHPIQPSTLGSGNFAYLAVPPIFQVITVEYTGIDREARWTTFYRDHRSTVRFR